MYPANPSNVPVQAGYVPYFYESGRFLMYPVPARDAPRQASYFVGSGYDFSSDVPLHRTMGRIQTVEQVIEKGYFAVPQGDPVTAIISDRKHTSRFGLDDVISQIRHRYVLYNQNMEELDESICEANNGLFRQVAAQGGPADIPAIPQSDNTGEKTMRTTETSHPPSPGESTVTADGLMVDSGPGPPQETPSRDAIRFITDVAARLLSTTVSRYQRLNLSRRRGNAIRQSLATPASLKPYR